MTEIPPPNVSSVWVWVRVDWDLLRDDIDSATGLIPQQAFLTLDQCKRAVEHDWETFQREFTPEDERRPLEWESFAHGNEHRAVISYGAAPGGRQEPEDYYLACRLSLLWFADADDFQQPLPVSET